MTVTPTQTLQTLLAKLNRNAGKHARITHTGSRPFGRHTIEAFALGNGLRALILRDPIAPVISYHTWFRVGSRHEVEGKTGLAHLFEHLMFNETRNHPQGRFDSLMERVGAETNAATWNDWTYYYENVPADSLALVMKLESDRMHNLVLRQGPVASEKEVVANERRYRVDDDVEGAIEEVLWATAYTEHPYHHPTIGWMNDILNFTPADCRAFYKTWYAPNNATVVMVGDIDFAAALKGLQKHYGGLKPSKLPATAAVTEAPQKAERRVELTKPTASDKIVAGYRCPGMGHPDHAALTVLCEALTGGRSSRMFHALVTVQELASDVDAAVSSFRDPGLCDFGLTARGAHTAAELVTALDASLAELATTPISQDERDRAIARTELSFLRGMETASGRAEQIGFYDTVLDDPAGALSRLAALQSVTVEQLAEVAARYLVPTARTLVIVHADASQADETEAA